MLRETNIALWDRFSNGHWLRNFGKTEVIIIDDEIHATEPLLIPPDVLDSLTQRLNIEFYYFSKDPKDKWDVTWFESEFAKMKTCKNPAVIFLDLMFGKKQKTPYIGSGVAFLEIIRSDPFFSDVPIIIHTAGTKENQLVQQLKDKGSCQGFLKKGYSSAELEETLLEFALLSDPNIHAHSKAMRIVAQDLRKLALDDTLVEEIQGAPSNIPMAAFFVGNSGDGKNYLARYLISISDRAAMASPEMTFSTVSRPEDVEAPLFGSAAYTGAVGNYYVFDSETGNFLRNLRNPNNPNLRENEFVLSIIGMISHADHGTIILNELGNAHPSMQRELLRFLDDRVIKPHLYSQYIPILRPYDVWVIVTMQPKHKTLMEDLETRLDKMRKIKIPSLVQRAEDILPLAAFTLDRQMAKKPGDLFRPEALSWLKDRAPALSVRTFTGLIRNLKFESSIGHYNATELERAHSKLKDLSSDEDVQIAAQGAMVHVASTKDFVTEQTYRQDIEFPIQHYRLEMVKSLIFALEKEKHRISGEPEYPATLYALTGEKTSSRKDKEKEELTPLQCHRKLGDIIFSVSDKELVQLIKESRSKVFIQAIIQLGRKIDTAKGRLNTILNSPEVKSDKELIAFFEEVNSAVAKRSEPYRNRQKRKLVT